MRLRDVREQSGDGSSRAIFAPRMIIEFGKVVGNGTLLVAAECDGMSSRAQRNPLRWSLPTSTDIRRLFFSFHIDRQSMARLERHESKLDAIASNKLLEWWLRMGDVGPIRPSGVVSEVSFWCDEIKSKRIRGGRSPIRVARGVANQNPFPSTSTECFAP